MKLAEGTINDYCTPAQLSKNQLKRRKLRKRPGRSGRQNQGQREPR